MKLLCWIMGYVTGRAARPFRQGAPVPPVTNIPIVIKMDERVIANRVARTRRDAA